MSERVTPRSLSGDFEWDELTPYMQGQAGNAFQDIYRLLVQCEDDYITRQMSKFLFVVRRGELVGRREKGAAR